MKGKRWILAKHFDGFPKDSDLKLEVVDIPDPKDGEITIEAVYLSVDPYMRPYTASLPEGSLMIGQQVAKVIKSKNKDYKVGELVAAMVGWTSHATVDPAKPPPGASLGYIKKLPQIPGVSPSCGLGVLGMTGATAYFGLLRLCDPKPGETVLVNAGAGAVGSLVGQIAKIKGCKVIGYAGTAAKCAWMKELGFDYAFNYKTENIDETLKKAAPEGIDCYFDNVGGDFTNRVLTNHMKLFGRIANCGAIDQYNDKTGETATAPPIYGIMIRKQLKMEGFLVPRFMKDMPEFFQQQSAWLKEGKLKFKEHITKGFENMPKAFMGMLKGENTGKAIVEV